MKFIADLHIHSRFSLATSRQLTPEHLDYWAKIKGIDVVACGDFTHPAWTKELKEKLEPAEPGLFKLKKSFALTPLAGNKKIRFLLSAEISSIYKKAGKVRKVHNVILAPDFKTVETIQARLTGLGGNITSDGRPILGLDSRNLLELCLEASPEIFFIPAHIWTPWFSALGAKSGFDSIAECYSDLSGHIHAVETGLSSDAPMNWMCSFLDKYTLLSNSDAHSPEKLGRNANIFDTELSYFSMTEAMKTGQGKTFLGTIDLFPQEGKYHYDGHRKCGICWNPLQTLEHNCICPECGRKITVGVMNRVVQLSDRSDISQRPQRLPFYSIIPLKEILSEINKVGPNSKKIAAAYEEIIKQADSELDLLINMPPEKIKNIANAALAEAVRRMRQREVIIKEGFDGEYGQIKLFDKKEIQSFSSQKSLFSAKNKISQQHQSRKLIDFDLNEYRKLQKKNKTQILADHEIDLDRSWVKKKNSLLKGLNPEQKKAAQHLKGPALILAGPGTGKTKTLTTRIAWLISEHQIKPENILAVTFTNKASEEMQTRLKDLLCDQALSKKINISTFHGLGYSLLKEHFSPTGRKEQFAVIDEKDKQKILNKLDHSEKKAKQISGEISRIKQNCLKTEDIADPDLASLFSKYRDFLKTNSLFDLDDLIYEPVLLLDSSRKIRENCRQRFAWIMIDEYQDINLAQYKLISLLLPDNKGNLAAIGDPNQAIYGFRGADVTFIRRFQKDFPSAPVYSLKKSYRCTDSILKASHFVIKKGDPSASLLKGLDKGIKITISRQATEKSEAEYIARTIENMIGGLSFYSLDSKISEGCRSKEINSLSDFAVLCRIKSQMRALEKAFIDHSIPFQAIGDVSLFNQEPVISMLDLLKLALAPDNLFLLSRVKENPSINTIDLNRFYALIKGKTVKETVTSVLDRYFSTTDMKRTLYYKKITAEAEDFGTNLEAFLNRAVLGSAVDSLKPDTEQIALMTLHAAKGLEFQCVFIAGCEDGLLPYSLFETQRSDPEEERRLLYVGMTRAKKYLYLSHCRKHFLLGREYKLDPSPFLKNIEQELVERTRTELKKKKKKDDRQMSLF